MFAYSSAFKSHWNKKIVFAPNGFGKTTNSKQLAEELRIGGKKVKLFTQKTLEDLVSTFDDDFFLGPTAKLEAEKLEIQKKLEKANPFVKGTNAKTMTAAASSSFVLSYYKIKKASDIPNTLEKDNKRIREKYSSYSDDDLLTLDKELNYQLYLDIQSFITNTDFSNIENEAVNQLEVDSDTCKNIYSLFLYSKLNNFNDCLLCGKHYKNTKTLINHIEGHMNILSVRDDQSSLRKLNALAKRVIDLVNNSESTIIRDVFSDISFNTIKKKYLWINMYISLCKDDIVLFSDKVGNVLVNDEGDSAFDYISRVHKIEEKIKRIESVESDNLIKIDEFNTFVCNEIESIMHFDNDIKVVPNRDKKGFSFKVNNKKQKANDFLSTSEFKRLVLVVLYAEIKYSKIDALILDDPIDSYDDYTKLLAIKYIKTILSSKKLKDWYLLTNDFECASNLSYIKKCNVLFYLANPDYVYNGIQYSYWEQECTYKEVAKIGLNDLSYLVSFITRRTITYPYDKDIMLCSLTVPLRNIRTEIVKELKNINVTISTAIDTNWVKDVSNCIESCYEHYRPDLYKSFDSTIARSSTLRIDEVARLFSRLHTSSRNVPSSYLLNSSSIVAFRDTVARRAFTISKTNTYSDIINYLFLKALMIENVKYIFEKKIVDKGYASFSQTDMDSILDNASGLQSIINGIENLNNTTPVRGIASFIANVSKIHEDYSVIYNSVDHSTTRMISPYLSLSIKDIKQFKEKVESL